MIKQFQIFLLFLLAILNQSHSQELFQIKGYIALLPDSIPLNHAIIVVSDKKITATTDSTGYFTFLLPPGKAVIEIKHIKIVPKTISIEIPQNRDLLIYVLPETREIGEIDIAAYQPNSGITDPATGKIKLSQKEIKQIPNFMGESDIITALKTLPGVQAGGEGDQAMHVRGGGPGENLVFLDYIPVYNPSHLLGIYSPFNSDIINDATLYKGVFPASFGGRTSSVLHIRTSSGKPEQLTVKGSAGLIHSKIFAKMALSNNVYLQASFRRSYLEPVLRLNQQFSSQNNKFVKGTQYYFYDAYTKTEIKINDKNRIIADFISGSDQFSQKQNEFGFKSIINWGNMAGSLRWNYIKPSFSSNQVIGLSDYKFGLNASFFPYQASVSTSVKDYFYKSHFDIAYHSNHIKTGFELVYHQVTPANISASVINAGYKNKIIYHAITNSVFVNDEINISEKWSVLAGLRINLYARTGPAEIIKTDKNSQITDTIVYRFNHIFEHFISPEPRISALYKQNENLSYKFSYSHNYQYLHLVTIGSVSFPSDIWFPSTKNVQPEKCHQITGGIFYFSETKFQELSAEVFYKNFKNLTEYTGSLLTQYDNTRFENNLLSGKGHAYGIEFQLSKKLNHFTCDLSYTLSRSIRIFPGLNNGKPYPAKYDRTHDLSAGLTCNFNRHWNVSLLWVYSTGNAVNLPAGRYMVQGMIINDYNQMNSYRMPSFHRLNLSASYTVAKNNNYESIWNFSIYNVYNRANPFYMFFIPEGNLSNYDLKIKVKKIALFPVMPSVSWNFKF